MSYQRFKRIAIVVEQEVGIGNILDELHKILDEMSAFGSQTKSDYAEQSRHLLEKDIEGGLVEGRICSECKAVMTEGYVIGSGDFYFCSDKCLHKNYTPLEWLQLHKESECDNYFTNWGEV